MSKACVRVAALLSIVGVGCGASQGGGGAGDNDPFSKAGTSGSGASGGNNGTIGGGGSSYFKELMPGKGGTSGGGESDPDKVCDTKKFDLQKVEPDIVVVLDRSGSMRRTAEGSPGNGTNDKWTATTAALKEVLAQTEKNVNWGLQLFSTCQSTGMGYSCAPNPCAVTGLSQAPALSAATALDTMISSNAPVLDIGATPTRAGIEAAVKTLAAANSGRKGFLLVATDGMPTCKNTVTNMTDGGGDDADGTVAAVTAAVAAGYEVFVVGIATADSPNSFATLERMATAGGRAQMGGTKHYPVASRATLVAALTDIAGQVQSCTLGLGPTAPPSPEDVAVKVDGQRITKGTDWDYGPGNTSVVVKGTWCEKLKAGTAKNAEITFGCPGIPIL